MVSKSVVKSHFSLLDGAKLSISFEMTNEISTKNIIENTLNGSEKCFLNTLFAILQCKNWFVWVPQMMQMTLFRSEKCVKRLCVRS